MSKIFLIDLEAVETRYTAQWKTHLPKLLEDQGHDVRIIEGPSDIPSATTPGAFLNFGGTNIYKARQVEEFSRLFTSGKVSSGDHFIFTDAWHPGIINLKYMSELLGIKVKIHALWHAGSYDPADFLGRLIGDAPWCRYAEKAFYEAIDFNYFATEFHIKMFGNNLLDMLIVGGDASDIKICRTGWPMEYMPELFEPYSKIAKRDLVLFPHRIAPEKQVEIFRDLADSMPEYEFIVCQDQQLTKDEYHTLLGEAKVVFSANLQETLGISCYEGALCGATPLVPDRLSYQEMYTDIFKYPTEYTDTWDNYVEHKEEMMDAIRYHVDNHESVLPKVKAQARVLTEKYFSAQGLLANLE